jgi:uncharacterized membrane protein
LTQCSGRSWPHCACRPGSEWTAAKRAEAATRAFHDIISADDPMRTVENRGASALNRICPNCSSQSISVTELIFSDAICANCDHLVRVHWLFRTVFFVAIFIATLLTVLVVLVDQGLYAAILMFTVPIGALGFIKARFSPLVSESQNSARENS